MVKGHEQPQVFNRICEQLTQAIIRPGKTANNRGGNALQERHVGIHALGSLGAGVASTRMASPEVERDNNRARGTTH